MSLDQENKWDFAEKALAKKQQDLVRQEDHTESIMSPTPSSPPKGIIESFKQNKLERNKRLEMLSEKTKGELDAYKHFIHGQVIVTKQRIDLHVETQLMEIGKHHLDALREIGISNFEDRQRALEDLTRRSSEHLQRINQMDVPPSMKQKLLDAVFEGFEQLFERIKSEEIRPEPRGKQ